jgi:hypothetical protein
MPKKRKPSPAGRPPTPEPEFAVVKPDGWEPSDALVEAVADLLLDLAGKRATSLAGAAGSADNKSSRQGRSERPYRPDHNHPSTERASHG